MKKATLALAVLSTFALAACQKDDAKEAAAPAAESKTETVAVEAPAANDNAAAQSEYTTDSQKHSYALGASMGLFAKNRLDQQKDLGMDFDEAALKAGFQDGLLDQTDFTMTELQDFTREADMALQAKQTEKANAAAASNIAEGEAYLATNAQKEGVTVTESGLQYEVLTEGTGASPASATSTVKVHYRGTLLDGTEFDSSYSRGEPATFPLNRVIAGWTEGVQLMKEGAKYRFHIPSGLAYGERATGKISE
jgi:FKBP-type peptidyl-prolyl cis-trans isomerase FkpA